MSSRQDTFGDALRKGNRSSFFLETALISNQTWGYGIPTNMHVSVHPPNILQITVQTCCPWSSVPTDSNQTSTLIQHVLWSEDQEAILGPCERTWSLLCHKSKLMEANCLGNSASLGHAWQVVIQVIHGLSWNCYDQAMPWGFADSRYFEIDIFKSMWNETDETVQCLVLHIECQHDIIFACSVSTLVPCLLRHLNS